MKGHPIAYSAAELAWVEAHCTMSIMDLCAAFQAQFARTDVSAQNLHSLPMTTTPTYTAANAQRLILSGEATGPMNVTGSLDLGDTRITALPDNLTVGGWLDLRGVTSLSVPTPWWRENGEATRRRCIAIDPFDGYALLQTDTDRFTAGCRENLTSAQALKHWSRTDARAVLFTAAVNAHVLEPVA